MDETPPPTELKTLQAEVQELSAAKRKAILALCLLAPAPSLGIVANLTLADVEVGPTTLGTILFALCKIWLFSLPAIWFLFVDKNRPSLSPVRRGGWAMALLTGTIAFVGIVGGYVFIGRSFIDPKQLQTAIEKFQLNSVSIYLLAAAYWCFVNSVLEEYVFRWFLVKKCEQIMPATAAIFVSAFIFVVHHTIAMAEYFPAWINLIASVAIFGAGACWSWLYVRYKSVWIPYLSHLIADIAIFGTGYWMLWGPGGILAN